VINKYDININDLFITCSWWWAYWHLFYERNNYYFLWRGCIQL